MNSDRTRSMPQWMIQPIWVLLGHLPVFLSLAVTSLAKWSPTTGAGAYLLTAETAAGFTFTMMGFLVTAVTLLSLFSESRVLRRYRKNGYLRILVTHVGITMLELSLLFAFAMFAINHPENSTIGAWLVHSSLACLGMTVMTVLPILLLHARASQE